MPTTTNSPSDWLLLIATVPGQNNSLRLRFWRQLKALGAAILRDGVYLLPLRPDLLATLEALRTELLAAAGSAYVLRQPAPEPELQADWIALFERGEVYEEWRGELNRTLDLLGSLSESDARRQLRQCRKNLDAIIATDYFPGDGRQRAEQAWQAAEVRVTRFFSPDEPVPAAQDVVRLDLTQYQRRQWATRRRPWVDRIASAWLIRRFIDPRAEFHWLADVKVCPRDALGFDFDGAAFTHVGDLVSFEVLLASFGLQGDPALQRLGALVHALDLGTEATPEAVGFEAILAGARSRIADDDALLAEMSGTLDSLYAYFQGNGGAS